MAGVKTTTRLIMYSIVMGLCCVSGLIWGFREIRLMMLFFFILFIAVEIFTYISIRKRIKK